MFLMTLSYADQFFKDFCSFYVQLCHEFCKVPSTQDEMEEVESVYRRMGLPKEDWKRIGKTDKQ